METQNDQVKCKGDVDRLLWKLAAKGEVVDKGMKALLTEATDNDELRDYIEQRSREFNQTVQALYDHEGSTFYELQQAKRLLGRRHDEYAHALYEFKKYENIKMKKYMEENRGDRKVALRLLAMLQNPRSRIYKAYDLASEADVEAYLGWFRLWRWRFPLSLLSKVERLRYHGQELTVLRRMVESHNRQFSEMGPE